MMPLRMTFSFPTTTLFGAGTLVELPKRLQSLGVSRPLVVTDPGLLPTTAFQKLKMVLDTMPGGWALFAGVHPNPGEMDVIEGAAKYRIENCDGVVAFGGGSALDVGKAVRLLVNRPGLILSEFDWRETWTGLAPCVCIPTTAGTGSEVGRSSVIIIEKSRRKAVLFNPALMASLVVLDPELTVDLPPKLTAATGADALTHCIESFTSPSFHPLCDGIALEGIHLGVRALPLAVSNGQDLEARGHMLVVAAMGAVDFQKDLGATHSLAHPLSTVCGMHHGLANALCLPVVMRFNASRKPGLYRRVGLACGLDIVTVSETQADNATIEFIAELFRKIGIVPGLRPHGVSEAHVTEMTPQAFADGCHATNPVPVTEEDLRALYLQAL